MEDTPAPTPNTAPPSTTDADVASLTVEDRDITDEIAVDDVVTTAENVDDDLYVRPSEDATADQTVAAIPFTTIQGAPSAPPPPQTGVAPQAPTKSRGNMLGYLLVAVVAGIVGTLLTYAVLTATGAFDTEAAPVATVSTTAATATPIVTEITNDIGSAVNPTAVAQKVLPSIVTVNVFSGEADSADGQVATGSGSGVVMSTEGYIITNHHVIDGADSFAVTFEDARTYEAELIGSDSLTDLAVLKISAADLVPAEFGSADSLAVGDPAVAVGNPLGQQGGASITVGIISAFDRRVDFADETSLFGMIQTDAAINSGSSGGALVDAEGRLVGITSAIGVSNAGPEGIGYAIPIELVDRITSEIIETGDVEHPFLGVTIQTTFETAEDGATVPGGALIESIEGADSAAGAAGIEAGDVVVAIGGDSIATQSDLILAVRLYRVGDTVTFTVNRDGELLDFEVVLGQRPPEFQG